MNVLPFEKQTQVIAAITEGCSIRSTERLTGVNRNTIMSLGLRVGEGCERLHDRLMRDLQVNLIELSGQLRRCVGFHCAGLNAESRPKLPRGKAHHGKYGSAGNGPSRPHPESSTDHFRRLCAVCRRGRGRFRLGCGLRHADQKICRRYQPARCGSPLLAGSRLWRRSGGDKRLAGFREDQHGLCRAVQFVITDADAPIYPPNEWLLEKAGKPCRCRGPVGCLLQPVPCPRNAALYARDGARRDRSHLDDCRASTGRASAVRHFTLAATSSAHNGATRPYAIQAACDSGRENE
jgi:hypothetical protein